MQNAKLKNAANAVALEAEQRANQKVAHVTAQYEQRFSELRGSLEADCKRIVDETVEYAKNGMEGFKKEEQAVIQEIREECSRQENQAAETQFPIAGTSGGFDGEAQQVQRPGNQCRQSRRS